MNIKLFTNDPVIIKLKNGLNVHLIKEESNLIYAQLDIPVGSMILDYKSNEDQKTISPGIHHFLEHKIFASEKGDAFKDFAAMGVLANAMTTYRQTSYIISGLDNMDKAVKELINMLETPYFTDENVEAEKRIIIEEIEMYEDDPDTLIYQKMYEMLLYNHPIKHDIAGSKEDVLNVTKEDLYEVYYDFYHHPDRQLIISGPIDIEYYKTMLNNIEFPQFEEKIIESQKITEPLNIKNNEDFIYLDVSLSSLSIGLKMQADSDNEKELFELEMQTLFLTQLIFGNSSPLTNMLIEKGLIDDTFSMQITVEDRTLVFQMDAHSNDTESLKSIVLDYFFKEGSNDLVKENFELIKKAYLGAYIMALDNIENRIYLYGKYILCKMDLLEAIKIVKEFKIEKIFDLYSKITKEMFAALHVFPKEY